MTNTPTAAQLKALERMEWMAKHHLAGGWVSAINRNVAHALVRKGWAESDATADAHGYDYAWRITSDGVAAIDLAYASKSLES